jgi:hypothetical protein
MRATQLISLYGIYVEMIGQGRMRRGLAIELLSAAGLSTTDFDTWVDERERVYTFTTPFPKKIN